MLSKLDFVAELAQCSEVIFAKKNFAVLLINMIMLEKPELQRISIDLFTKLCDANFTSIILTNFLSPSKPLEYRIEGVVFVSKVIGMLSKLS